MFHVPLTVMLSFSTPKGLLIFNVVQVFQNASMARFISNEHYAYGAAFAFG